MFPALKEASDKLAEKQQQLRTVFDEAGPEMDMGKVKSIDGDSHAKVEQIRSMNEELDDLGAEVDRLKAVNAAAERAKKFGADDGSAQTGDDSGPGAPPAAAKSAGDLFVESKAFTNRNGSNGPEATVDLNLKTLFETGAGWADETTRGPRVVLDAQRPIQVADLIPQTTTNQTAVTYMEETTFTNNAAEVAEGGTKPEAALALTEQSDPVRKIAVWIPVTEEQLEDVPRVRSYLNNRLGFMVRQRLDEQILVGNGTAPNLSGILDRAGIQTQAKSTDPVPDAVYKAIVKVRVTGQAMPNAVVFHPNDWQGVRLLRTADGIYIWGSPSESGSARIWGLPAVEAQALTENTALVGDFGNYSELATKKGLTFKVSDSHSTYFVENKVAILAEMRAALVIYRPAAFCTVTGI